MQTGTSLPTGALADRVGHRRLLVIGYAMGAGTALKAFAFATETNSLMLLAGIFTLAGLYIAVEEALEASLTAEYVPEPVRGIGYGILGSVNGVGDFVSSAAMGLLWTAISPVFGFGLAAAMMAIGTFAMARLRD